MEDNEAKDLLYEIFDLIEKSNTPEELEKFRDIDGWPPTILKFYDRVETNYHLIPFSFTNEEKAILKNNLSKFTPEKFMDPYTKLFYAMLWKQGDLPKLIHIIEGLVGKEKTSNQGMVLHQFGKYLNNKRTQPIIDQHVVRAYKVFKNLDNDSLFNEYRRINQLETGKHKTYIAEYVEWIKDMKPKMEGGEREKFLFKVDRILMALGKAIKTK